MAVSLTAASSGSSAWTVCCSGVLGPESEGLEGRPERLSDSTGPVEGWEEIVLLVFARKGCLGCQPHRPGSLSTLPLPYLSVNVKKLFVCRFAVAVDNVSRKRVKL